MVLHIFSFADVNQNSCCKFTNIFMMQTIHQEQKISYDWLKTLLINFTEIQIMKNLVVYRDIVKVVDCIYKILELLRH